MLEILEGGKGFLISDFPKFKLINHHALSLSTPRSHSSLSFLIAIYLSARLSWHYVKKTQCMLVMVIMPDNGDDDMYINCRLKQRTQKTSYLTNVYHIWWVQIVSNFYASFSRRNKTATRLCMSFPRKKATKGW